ncbi:ArnT family glycosyltransferase [Rariglobus hedericola]|nr:glycosyltransferase family 39 protein [Rariglobus hedericola]
MPLPSRSAFITACVAMLLAFHFWLGVSATFEKCVTNDETAHLTAGYSYWKFNDYRLQPENGNLPQRWAALPLLFQKPRLKPADRPLWWEVSDVWMISNAFFFKSGNNTDFMLASARAMMMLWSVATGLLVFIWGRRLWGDAGGLLGLALYVFSATTLAHGPLVTSDMTVTFFLLAAVGAYWRHMEHMNAGSVCLSLVVTGIAAVAKFSFLILLPVYGILILWRLAESTPISIAWGRKVWLAQTLKSRAGYILVSVILHASTAWFVIWMSFGFRFDACGSTVPSLTQYYMSWDMVMPTHGFWHVLISVSRNCHLLPDAYLQGFSYVLHASQERSAFLNGEYSNTGWVSFFPFTFLVKTPPAELLAIVLTGCAIIAHWRAKCLSLANVRRVAPLLVLFVVYWAFSLTSNLNIGHRHILPVYPALFIICGLLVRPAASAVIKWLAGTIIVIAAITAFNSYPNYLSYFNFICGGPTQGYKHLVDSSLDWGQDLPGLQLWLQAHRKQDENVYLSYCGMGNPRYEGIQADTLSPFYDNHQQKNWIELQPGLYCISATLLQDTYSPWRGAWTLQHEQSYQMMLHRIRPEIAAGKRSSLITQYGDSDAQAVWALDRLRFARLTTYLRLRKPDAMVNYSILVYKLSQDEVYTAVDGSLSSLAHMIEDTVNSPKP